MRTLIRRARYTFLETAFFLFPFDWCFLEIASIP